MIIPVDNWQEILAHYSGIQVVPAGPGASIQEVLVQVSPDIELAVQPAASSQAGRFAGLMVQWR